MINISRKTLNVAKRLSNIIFSAFSQLLNEIYADPTNSHIFIYMRNAKNTIFLTLSLTFSPLLLYLYILPVDAGLELHFSYMGCLKPVEIKEKISKMKILLTF